MPVKLSEIKGVMIEKKKCKWCDGSRTTSEIKSSHYVSCCPDGDRAEHSFNDALSLQSEVCIGLKRNELAKSIAEYVKTHSLLYDGCKGLADHIVSLESTLIESKGRNGEK